MTTAEATKRDLRRAAYESSRPDVQALVPTGARRILDLGCASGELGAALKRRQDAEVVGVELGEQYAADARTRLDRVEQGDLDSVLTAGGLGRFDCVIAADVLEHLVDPWSTLRRATSLLQPGGAVVVSLPNVRYALTYYRLIVGGRWPREPAGFFDATHLRWFTPLDAQELIEQAGCEVDVTQPRYFFRGRALQIVQLTARTRLAPFLAGQYLLRGLPQVNEGRPRVLVIAPAPVGPEMGGTAIRAFELARALNAHADVRLASPGAPPSDLGGIPVTAYHPQDPGALVGPLARAEIVVASPGWPPMMRALGRSGRRVIFDLYVPEAIETVGGFPDSGRLVRSVMSRFATDRLLDALAIGAGFICAGERQRDLILGVMLAERHIDPALVDADPSLRSVIDVVPFGLPPTPPTMVRDGPRTAFGNQIGAADEVILWNGGLWPWLDFATPIRAVAALHERRPTARLVFMGAAPQLPAQRTAEAARRLASELGVLDEVVHFNQAWVPYERRADWLLAAACSVAAHDDQLETRFAFRTRFLDCFWARLPVVCSRGDELADAVERADAGVVVAPGDVAGLTDALEAVLTRGRDGYRPGLDALAGQFAWDRVVRPLVRMVHTDPVAQSSASPRAGRILRRYGFLAARRALNAAGRRDWPAL